MDGANIERISKTLADETRLLIFEAIADNKGINCSKIATLRRVTPATVSHHLKILSHAGLIVPPPGTIRSNPDADEGLTRSPQPKRPEYASGSLRVSRHLLRKSSTDEMGVIGTNPTAELISVHHYSPNALLTPNKPLVCSRHHA